MPQSISNIRRRNLHLQLNLYTHRQIDAGVDIGASTSFADVIGVHKSLLSKLKGEGPSSRDISDSLARQIEAALKLPPGWMDQERDDAPPTPAEASFTQLALLAYRCTDSSSRTKLRKQLQSMVDESMGRSPKKL